MTDLYFFTNIVKFKLKSVTILRRFYLFVVLSYLIEGI